MGALISGRSLFCSSRTCVAENTGTIGVRILGGSWFRVSKEGTVQLVNARTERQMQGQLQLS